MARRKKYDAFISYAIEDKHTVAQPLAELLHKRGYSVWFTGNELKVGDSISEVVNTGLRSSRFGIVIISGSYLRPWATYELFTLDSKELEEKHKVILPVWHNITMDEVARMYPKLSDRYAISTREGIDKVCDKLGEALAKGKEEALQASLRKIGIASLIIAGLAAVALLLFPHFMPAQTMPSREYIKATIEKRIQDQQRNTDHTLQEELVTSGGYESVIDSVTHAYNMFIALTGYERNSYSFSNEYTVITGRKNLYSNGIPVTAAPYDAYGMSKYKTLVLHKQVQSLPDTVFNYSFAFLNQVPATFSIDTILGNDSQVRVRVSYTNYIRSVKGMLSYSKETGYVEKRHLDIKGFKPNETYIFRLEDDAWQLSGIE